MSGESELAPRVSDLVANLKTFFFFGLANFIDIAFLGLCLLKE
jgi:hypothetical protein